MAANRAFVQLSSGFQCPVFGLGTYLVTDPAILGNALRTAITAGYRHIDTAYLYDNESIIGQTLKELFNKGVVKRDKMFITTKLMRSHMAPEVVPKAFKKQLALLQLDYVDLYLIHSPMALVYQEAPVFAKDENGALLLDVKTKIEDTWLALEQLVKQGLVRSIGVSNFNQSQLERLLKVATIKPAMQQIESHPYFSNSKLIKFCHENNIQVTAFSPFGAPGLFNKVVGILQDERLIKIGAKYGKTSAQVCLRWQIQRGVVVIPKSENPTRVVDNFNIWDFELSPEDMQEIAKMDANVRVFKFDAPHAKRHPEYPFHELQCVRKVLASI